MVESAKEVPAASNPKKREETSTRVTARYN